MNAKKTLAIDDNPEWTEECFKKAVPFSELPKRLQDKLNAIKAKRGKNKLPTKQSTTVRFDADVIAALRSTGKGWQSRLNDDVRASLRLAGKLP